jgi:hypothetical protein
VEEDLFWGVVGGLFFAVCVRHFEGLSFVFISRIVFYLVGEFS